MLQYTLKGDQKIATKLHRTDGLKIKELELDLKYVKYEN